MRRRLIISAGLGLIGVALMLACAALVIGAMSTPADAGSGYTPPAGAPATPVLSSLSGITPTADTVIGFGGGGAATALPCDAQCRTTLSATSALAGRSAIDAQQASSALEDVATLGQAPAADRYLGSTGLGTLAWRTITAMGASLVDDIDAPAMRSTLGLTSAATTTMGTAANNLVQLDGSARLPAVDGSQLTNLPGGSVSCSWSLDWTAEIDGRATTEGLTETGGTHALEDDAAGVARQKITGTSGIVAHIGRTTGLPAEGDAWEAEIDTIHTGGASNQDAFIVDSGAGKRMSVRWNSAGTYTTVGAAALHATSTCVGVANTRRVVTLRHSAGTVKGAQLWVDGRYCGELGHQSFDATAATQIYAGKLTTTGANTVYIYAMRLKTDGWCSADPGRRHAQADITGAP